MPALYRSMRSDPDGYPMTGETSRTLGVRRDWDVFPDPDEVLYPGGGGLSVAPDDPTNLLEHRRPPESGGSGRDPVWVINTGDLPADLTYTADETNPKHGFLEPA